MIEFVELPVTTSVAGIRQSAVAITQIARQDGGMGKSREVWIAVAFVVAGFAVSGEVLARLPIVQRLRPVVQSVVLFVGGWAVAFVLTVVFIAAWFAVTGLMRCRSHVPKTRAEKGRGEGNESR